MKLPYRYCPYDRKRTWDRRKLAQEAIDHMDPEEPGYLYWCPEAGGWHITTKPPGDYDRKQVLSNGRGTMTDPELARAVKAMDSAWTEPIPEVEVELACPCGSPIRVRLGGGRRSMAESRLDPAAELLSLTVYTEHHSHSRRDGVGMYVVL